MTYHICSLHTLSCSGMAACTAPPGSARPAARPQRAALPGGRAPALLPSRPQLQAPPRNGLAHNSGEWPGNWRMRCIGLALCLRMVARQIECGRCGATRMPAVLLNVHSAKQEPPLSPALVAARAPSSFVYVAAQQPGASAGPQDGGVPAAGKVVYGRTASLAGHVARACVTAHSQLDLPCSGGPRPARLPLLTTTPTPSAPSLLPDA